MSAETGRARGLQSLALRLAGGGAAAEAAAWLRPRGRGGGRAVARSLALPRRGEARVGRDADCELWIDAASVSRHHATLVREDGVWSVIDQGSANGTFVNGNRVTRQALQPGDLVAFGPEAQYSFVQRRTGGLRLRVPSPLGLQLVARGPQGGKKRHLLHRRLTVIGRSDTADIVLPSGQVSAIHARIDRRGGRLFVCDLGSLNGSFLNGQPIKEAALGPGDRLSFADCEFDVRVAPVPSLAGMIALGLAALIATGWLLAPSLTTRAQHAGQLWTRDMYVEQARRSLAAAVKAHDEGGPRQLQIARSEFDTAIRALVAADRLPVEAATEADIAAALREIAGDIEDRLGGRDVYALYAGLEENLAAAAQAARVEALRRLAELAEREQPPAPSQDAPPPPPAESTAGTEPVDAGPPADEVAIARPAAAPNLQVELGLVFSYLGIDTYASPVPADLQAQIERALAHWTGPQRDYTQRSLSRAQSYLPMIKRELIREKLPVVLSYLPFIESGYQNQVESPARARGMWQFMPGTARQYGLRVDDHVDERTDPEKATSAACQYLRGLLATFGPDNFLCAIAAYNKGHYGMVNCLLQVDPWSKWKFWDVVMQDRGCFKPETVEYVPRFLAAAVIMENPEAYGFAR